MKDFDVKAKFIELRAKDYSYVKIGKILNISKQTAICWNKDFQQIISRQRNLNLQALYQKALLTKQQKITFYTKMLKKISDEILKRDFANVPIDKLFDKFFMIHEKLELDYNSSIDYNIDVSNNKVNDKQYELDETFNLHSHTKGAEFEALDLKLIEGEDEKEEIKASIEMYNQLDKMTYDEWLEEQRQKEQRGAITLSPSPLTMKSTSLTIESSIEIA